MKRDISTKFGKRMRELREAKTMTQAEIASLILKSVETVSNFERGKTLPGLRTLARISEVLGVEPSELLAFGKPIPFSEADAIDDQILRRLSQMPTADRKLVAEFVDLLIRHRRA
jgi:transcriptional regulator with XRE-family HTH domain